MTCLTEPSACVRPARSAAMTTAMHMFAWMTPGEVRIYEPGQLADAKSWAAG